jgi:arylsulfatase A-like enzyme
MQRARTLLDRHPALRRAVALVALAALGCSGSGRGTRVVLVTLDTLRIDTFLGDADRASAMPRTLAWAEGGALFERCFSTSPVTQPAHASLLTGMFPWQHGVTRNGQVLDAERRTVAEILGAAGWKTGAVVASFPLTRRMGLDQGFEHYVDALDRRIGKKWNDMEVDEFYSLADAVTDRALELLGELDGDRQFVWLHYFDPHAPYGDAGEAPEASGRDEPLLLPQFMKSVFEAGAPAAARAAIAYGRGLYERDARALDEELGRLFAALARDESRFETHIVLVADHGESFGEDGSLGHGKRLTESQIVVPLVVHSSRVVPGRRRDAVGSVDVAATLLALSDAGVRLPHGRDLTRPFGDGLVAGMRTSFTAPFHDPRLDGEERLLESDRWFVVIDDAIHAGGAGDADPVWTNDDESRAAPPGVAETARGLFRIFAEESTGARALDDAATRAALEALGYTQ